MLPGHGACLPRILFSLFLLAGAGQAFLPPAAAGEGGVVAGAAGLTEAKTNDEMRAEHARLQETIRERLRQIKVLMKLGRLSEALDLSKEVLLDDPANTLARSFHDRIVLDAEDMANKNTLLESKRRDKSVIREVSEWSMPPERGVDLPRPNRVDEHPFRRNEDATAAMRAALAQVIPEINVVDTDVAYVLQLLFKTHDVNIIYPPAAVAEKKITVQARNISLGDILQYLSRNQGLHYTITNGVIWLYSEGASGGQGGGALFKPEIIRLKNGLTLTGSIDGGDDEGGGGGNRSASGTSDIEALMGWMEANWPGWPPESRWYIDRKTNALIISSSPDIIDDVREMVNMVDVAPVQIMITTVFVTIGENDFNQLGFNWGVTGNPQLARDPNYGARGFPNKTTIREAESYIRTPLAAYTQTPTTSLGLVGVLDQHQYTMTMEALTSRSSTKVMNAPRVIALNNSNAIIDITKTYPYIETYDVQTTTAQTDTNVASATTLVPVWAEERIGFKLEVFPSVGANHKTIYLEIKPDITEHDATNDRTEQVVVTNTEVGGNLTTDRVDVTRPAFATKKLTVRAVADDGETVVVGGLIKEDTDDSRKGVPVVDKIPVLNRFFSSKNQKRIRTFDLIFVTPRILSPDNRQYKDITAASVPTAQEVNRILGDPTLGASR